MLGNLKKAIKNIHCFCFEKVIDSNVTNYKDPVESIVEQYATCYLEVAHVQYYDAFFKICPKGTYDHELVYLFRTVKPSKSEPSHAPSYLSRQISC